MSEDYTGILIRDTYQNVLHRGVDGNVYDGIGNLFQVPSSSLTTVLGSIDVVNVNVQNNLTVTGSSFVGNDSSDVHQFTGSVSVSGSLRVIGPFYTYQTKRISSNYTASAGEFLLCDSTSSFSILVPNSQDDSQIGIKKLFTSSLVTIYTEGVNEVDENPSPLILAGKSSATLICNSNNWYII